MLYPDTFRYFLFDSSQQRKGWNYILKLRSISLKDSFILVAKVIAQDLLNEDNSAFLRCEMNSEKEQATLPSSEDLQHIELCLDASLLTWWLDW